MSRILIIDDEVAIRQSLREIFEYEDHVVVDTDNGAEGLALLKSEDKFDIVFCDIRMPAMDGMAVLREAMTFSDVPFVMISGHGDIETAVEAIKMGAYDFIQKPLDINRLLITLRNVKDRTQLISENKTLKRTVNKQYEMIGNSPALQEIHRLIDRVAPSNARVLITGENGTGKELVAHWLHEKSERAKEPFVEVNCAAIPSELIESELFGHEKGSFTSAVKQRKGKFELADGGTLFLDEIGDMSLSAQAKVLRALQENKITRVGGEKEIPVNVRVIAATNKNLKEEIEKKTFREDLYHRLSVIIIHVPTLAERKEDIPVLAEYFMANTAEQQGKRPLPFEPAAFEALQELPWTGNIRELRNVVERLCILCDKRVTAEDVKKYA